MRRFSVRFAWPFLAFSSCPLRPQTSTSLQNGNHTNGPSSSFQPLPTSGEARPSWTSSVKSQDILNIAVAIVPFEPVTLIVDPSQTAEAQALLQEKDPAISKKITVLSLPVDDLWARDTLPVFAVEANEGQLDLLGIDLNFNGWGNKQQHKKDSLLASRFLNSSDSGISARRIPSEKITGEGGSFEFDGEGTLMVTESSILNSNRNPEFTTRDELEKELKTLFNLKKVIWFPGLKGKDITDAHVDSLARFIKPGVVVVSRPPKEGRQPDEWTTVSDQVLSKLQDESDAKGRNFRVIQLHEPNPNKIEIVQGRENEFLSSYVNFLMVNGGIILPKFGDKEADDEAVRVLQEEFPEEKIVQVKITNLASGGGGIHCATKDIPTTSAKSGASKLRPLFAF